MSLVALLLLRGIRVQERRIVIQVGFETIIRMMTHSARDARLTAVRRDVGLRLDPGLEVPKTGNRSDEVGLRAPPIAFPRIERATQTLTDTQRLQAMTFGFMDARDLDARLNASSLTLEVEATLSQFQETEIDILAILEGSRRLHDLYDVEAAALHHLALTHGRQARPKATHHAVLPIVRRTFRRPTVPLELERST